jgi:hypothetical protein
MGHFRACSIGAVAERPFMRRDEGAGREGDTIIKFEEISFKALGSIVNSKFSSRGRIDIYFMGDRIETTEVRSDFKFNSESIVREVRMINEGTGSRSGITEEPVVGDDRTGRDRRNILKGEGVSPGTLNGVGSNRESSFRGRIYINGMRDRIGTRITEADNNFNVVSTWAGIFMDNRESSSRSAIIKLPEAGSNDGSGGERIIIKSKGVIIKALSGIIIKHGEPDGRAVIYINGAGNRIAAAESRAYAEFNEESIGIKVEMINRRTISFTTITEEPCSDDEAGTGAGRFISKDEEITG